MAQWCFALPVLPDQEMQAHAFTEEVHDRHEEYLASRRAAGITMERVYLMETPAGSFSIVYGEGAGYGRALQTLATSTTPFDTWFNARVASISGVDIAAGSLPQDPQQILTYIDADATFRRPGIAFCAPIADEKIAGLIAFFQQVEGPRREEMVESRRAKHMTRDLAFLSQTPMGAFVSIYLEGDDPSTGNKMFAASETEFDVWFKEQAGEAFGIDFDKPVPPVQTLMDWYE